MSQDLSASFAELEAFRQRARAMLAPARAELAEWYRAFFRRKKGPKSATHMVLTLLAAPDTPMVQWQFSWHPGMHSRCEIFTPSQPLPVIATEEDATAVGLLAGEAYSLRYVMYQDMTAEAWIEAGGESFPKKLLVSYLDFDHANPNRPWVERLQDQIRRQASGERSRLHSGLGAPEPIGLPTAGDAIMAAVRNGEPYALTSWADAAEQAGAADAANMLRWLPTFQAMIAAESNAVSPQFGFAITVNRNGTAWWWIGDGCSEADNADARNLGRMLSAWNETHPALEWLLRRLGFPHATVELVRYTTDTNGGKTASNLAAGEHLGPLVDDVRVIKVDVPAWRDVDE